MDVEAVVPMLHVTEVPRSIAWYRKLGCEVSATDESEERPIHWALLRLGAASFMLSQGDPGPAGTRRAAVLWFRTPDVQATYARLKDRVEVEGPPKGQWYGVTEISLCDPDGFEIMFTQAA